MILTINMLNIILSTFYSCGATEKSAFPGFINLFQSYRIKSSNLLNNLWIFRFADRYTRSFCSIDEKSTAPYYGAAVAMCSVILVVGLPWYIQSRTGVYDLYHWPRVGRDRQHAETGVAMTTAAHRGSIL